MLAGRIGGLRCGGPLFDWQRQRVEMLVISYHPPSHGRGMPEGQGVGRRRKLHLSTKIGHETKKIRHKN